MCLLGEKNWTLKNVTEEWSVMAFRSCGATFKPHLITLLSQKQLWRKSTNMQANANYQNIIISLTPCLQTLPDKHVFTWLNQQRVRQNTKAKCLILHSKINGRFARPPSEYQKSIFKYGDGGILIVTLSSKCGGRRFIKPGFCVSRTKKKTKTKNGRKERRVRAALLCFHQRVD